MSEKSILNGCMYVVEISGKEHLVYKVIKDISARFEPYVVNGDLVCSCVAGERGVECKHSKMVGRTLVGNQIEWKQAKRSIERYVRKIRERWKSALVKSLLDLKEEDQFVDVAHILVHGALNETNRERLTIWTEFGGLMLVLHVFKDRKRYYKTLRHIKRKMDNE